MYKPVSYPKNTAAAATASLILAGDVGATKTNLALFKSSDHLQLVKEASFKTNDYETITHALTAFSAGTMPDFVSLGVAGPVAGGRVKMTNAAQEINACQLSNALHHVPVAIINDLEATAYGMPLLPETEFVTLQTGKGLQGNAAIIAPGTGLGEAGLYWDGHAHHPYATEGGHSAFFPRSATDVELYWYLHQQYGHVSWERILSGSGIYNIYLYLLQVEKMDEPQWLAERIASEDPAAVISDVAATKKARICCVAIELFFRYLAMEAANLALKTKATGGLYIGGGILPKIYKLMDQHHFIKSFCDGGRMAPLLQQMRVSIILNDKTALLGAAQYAAAAQ